MYPHDYYDHHHHHDPHDPHDHPHLHNRGEGRPYLENDYHANDHGAQLPAISTLGRGPRGAGLRVGNIVDTDDTCSFALYDDLTDELVWQSPNLSPGILNFRAVNYEDLVPGEPTPLDIIYTKGGVDTVTTAYIPAGDRGAMVYLLQGFCDRTDTNVYQTTVGDLSIYGVLNSEDENNPIPRVNDIVFFSYYEPDTGMRGIAFGTIRSVGTSSETEITMDSPVVFTARTFIPCYSEIAEQERIANENARKAAELERIANENDRQTQEASRQANEETRIANENTRIANENERQANEAERIANENARKAAETARAAAEADRIAAESQRIANEDQRIDNEADRVAAEAQRVTNENARIAAEQARANAENTRIANENQRVAAEQTRASNETARQNAEQTRISNENQRIQNETARVQAEVEREEAMNETYEKMIELMDTANDTAVPDDLLLNKTAHARGYQLVGTIPSVQGSVITPSTVSQVAISSHTYAAGDIIVGALPSTLVDINDVAMCSLDEVNLTNASWIQGYRFMIDHTLKKASGPNVTEIGPCAFSGCVALSSIYFPEVLSIGSSAFAGTKIGSIDFPKLPKVWASVFYDCKQLSFANLPSVTEIGTSAFAYCYSLTEIKASSVTKIQPNAFAMCSKLESANFPLLSIVSYAVFIGCTSLSEINMPSVTKISGNAFSGCTSLINVSFPIVDTVDTNAFSNCTNLESISMPNLSSIGQYAFVNCNLKNVNLPNVTFIGPFAFSNNSNLQNITFSKPIEDIMSNTFKGCSLLTSLSFNGVLRIGNSAFASCAQLSHVYLDNIESVPSLSHANAFWGTKITSGPTFSDPEGFIHVPASLYNSFLVASVWSYFSSVILSM